MSPGSQKLDPRKYEMQVCDSIEACPRTGRPLHLALGMFDGVHMGHRAVISAAREGALRSGGFTGVLSFNPHPSRVLRPDSPTLMLMPEMLKQLAFRDLGVGIYINQTFSKEFASLDATAFLKHLQDSLPDLKAIYVGDNFRFGKGRSGTVDFLVEQGRKLGLQIYSAPRIRYDGEPISSTRIRESLQAGRITEVNAMLGRSYRLVAPITEGDKLGRKLGFPTFNLPWQPELAPRYGVYAVTVHDVDTAEKARVFGIRAKEGALYGVANYGVRPSVSKEQEPRLEVHLLLGEGDAVPEWKPGELLCVRLVEYLRDEQAFENVDALKVQIAQDKVKAVEYFGLL